MVSNQDAILSGGKSLLSSDTFEINGGNPVFCVAEGCNPNPASKVAVKYGVRFLRNCFDEASGKIRAATASAVPLFFSKAVSTLG
jgi:hypothetical protein